MNKLGFAVALAIGACLSGMAVPAVAKDASVEAERPHYSVETTTIGTLLDDPEAAAILERLIPSVYSKDIFQTMGRPNTLRTAAQYESAVLTESKLAEIQAEFDKLASKAPAAD